MTSSRPRSHTPAPLVALTATARQVEGVERVRLNTAYVRAVESVGLVPVVVPPSSHPDRAVRLLDTVAGLVLTGGEDVDPGLYGQPAHPALGPVNRARDDTEIALLTAARERGLPTLAICRGIQVVNVALGGTLVQDLPAQRAGVIPHELDARRTARVHTVRIEPGSRLASAVGEESLAVNSVHHQAVDRVAGGLRVSARAPDGVIEGVESTDAGWWLLGVQWHPEDLIATAEPWDRRLFAAFAEACAGRVSSAATSAPSSPAASASRASDGAGTAARR